jgi:hypothetical protein
MHLRIPIVCPPNQLFVVPSASYVRHLPQVYAASIMFGYFLRRVDQRFQLEKSIGTLSFNKVIDGRLLTPTGPHTSSWCDLHSVRIHVAYSFASCTGQQLLTVT